MMIGIDPGHGSFDPGAIGPTGLQEKEVTLNISLKLQQLLKKAGLDTFLSRAEDTALGHNVNSDLQYRTSNRISGNTGKGG